MSQRKRNKNDVFCPVPFIGIYYRGDDGLIQSCCWEQVEKRTDTVNGVDNHIDQSESDIMRFWSGPIMKKMRHQFMNNEWPESCDGCKKIEEAGKPSPRQDWTWAWNMLDNSIEGKPNTSYIDADYGNSTHKPLYFDYRPDNICNLGCAMCSPAASSILEKMVKENPKLDKHHVLKNNVNYEKLGDEDSIIETALGPHTRRMKLNGGEPTISARIKSIYEKCIANDWAKNIELQFTTNFTNTNKTFTDILPHFKFINMSASLDGCGDTYNYTRHPAKWTPVTNNVLKVVTSDKLKAFNIGTNLVWSVTTAFTIRDWLPQLAKYYLELYDIRRAKALTALESGPDNRSNFRGIGLTINQCWSPRWVALSVLPDSFKEFVSEEIKVALAHPDVIEFATKDPRNPKHLAQFQTGLDIFTYSKKHLTLWQDHITIYDRARGTDITQLHPKYKELLTYGRP